MNEFPSDTDAWTLTPFAMGPGRVARSEFDWRDALIGDEIGSGLRVPELTLTGMEEAQAWFAQGGHHESELSAVQDLVLFSAFDLVERGLPYAGPDFRFEPPTFAPFPLRSLAIMGTGKRVGKTAVTGHVARLLSRDREVVVVAMGRGGPPQPQLVEARPRLEDLLELSRAGAHAASDYLETAALAGVTTIGCRRCGGGLAGSPGESNVLEGAALAAELEPELVIFDGSGAAIPPVEVDARVLVTSSAQPVEVVTGYLTAYRILISDLVLVTGGADEPLLEAVAQVKDVPVVPVELRPRPVEPVDGRRVAFFTTAPAAVHETLAAHLAERHGADVVQVSGNLARREALREELERVDADTYLVEIKAAAIDVVAEAAVARGRELVFADNELVGESVDEALLALAPKRVPA